MKFRQTLSASDRHLVGRLESFGDIVVGFSLSQLALQLQIPASPHDVFSKPLIYIVFFGAFTILSMFWLRFHRVMATGFAPRRIDVALLFAFLAFIALVPYSLLTYMRLIGPAGYSREGFSLYLGVFGGVIIFSWLLSLRGMRRAWSILENDERRKAWKNVLTGFVVIPMFIIVLIENWQHGPAASLMLILIAPLIRLAPRFFPAPGAMLLGRQPRTTLGTIEPPNVS